MKKISIITGITFALCISLIYSSCKKKQDDPKPKDYSAAVDNAGADNAFAGVWGQINKVASDITSIRSGGYPIVTISPWNWTTWPKDITIDFGTTNVTGSDGVNRRGVIHAHMTGKYTDSNTVITVTLTNYYHNDNYVQGTQTIINRGHISAGHLVFNVVVNNATVTNTSGGVTTWNTNQNRVWFAGESTPIWVFDDVYKISGTASGTSTGGEPYTINTNSDLQVNIGCPWIVAGNFTLIMTNYPNYPVVFDYGSGTCDYTATALFNGTTYTIIMN